MFKLIKYGIKERSGIYVSLLILLASVNLIIYFANRSSIYMDPSVSESIFWVSFSAILIISVVLMGKDFYGREKSLVFSIPLQPYKIIGSRVIMMLIDLLAVYILNWVTSLILHPGSLFRNEYSYDFKTFLIMKLSSAFIYAFIPIVIYFAIAFSKCVLKFAKSSAVVFSAILIAACAAISELINAKILPSININLHLNSTHWDINNAHLIQHGSLNLTYVIFGVLFWAALFVASSKIVTKKLNL